MKNQFEVHECIVYKIWNNDTRCYWSEFYYDINFDDKEKAIKECKKLNDLREATIEQVKHNYDWLRYRKR